MLLQPRNKKIKTFLTTFSLLHPIQIIKMMDLPISNRRNPLWADKTFNNKQII
jgi:hypothetical protein